MNQRKRKAHTKSRAGCGNCKIRRVKCDEAKPRCRKCIAFGVSCNYGTTGSTGVGELVLSFEGASCMEAPSKAPISMNQTMLDLINHNLRYSPTGEVIGDQVYKLKAQDLEVLDRFSKRTILTLGTDVTKWILQAETPRLACLHPFLMHIVLAFTYTHDRLLQPIPDKPCAAELFHHYKGSALFNYRLREDATPSERDAIWITSTLIGAIEWSKMEAESFEEAWPLKDRDPGEPDYLTLLVGKQDVWDFLDPTRADCCFKSLLVKCKIDGEDTGFDPYQLKDGGFYNLPSPLLDFLGLTDPLIWHSSPYHRAANIISQLIPLEYNQRTLMKFTTFLFLMAPEFKDLWIRKDPGALLLISYWYAKTIPLRQWWTWKRAVLECQAICIFLERYHDDIPHLERLLEFPKRSCGLVSTKHFAA
ncbi:hypothetical protein J7T55_004816 [Diaporthe amygdali]|uniref:uncharacterized protein n=1 Tax=Phomopsis amygdali TaxID=1214568 RepID=UPI0022FE039A|nr:uncharacterized protein J7T55_004816 [Diaporthe amygdali]KAJ0114572.1 hypothetical protein J7T55_004816 [Diaporthe amygdali]